MDTDSILKSTIYNIKGLSEPSYSLFSRKRERVRVRERERDEANKKIPVCQFTLPLSRLPAEIDA